jgi:hypothetical protein
MLFVDDLSTSTTTRATSPTSGQRGGRRGVLLVAAYRAGADKVVPSSPGLWSLVAWTSKSP